MTEEKTKKVHKSDSFDVMKELVEKMMLDPERAKKAVHDRNVIIKSLKADIAHRKVAFGEIEARYDDISERLLISQKKEDDALKLTGLASVDVINLKDELIKAQKELEASKKEKDLLGHELHRLKEALSYTIEGRVITLSKKLPKPISPILRFLFSKPAVDYVKVSLFAILVIASITGWGFVYAALEPLVKLISSFWGG